MLMAKEGRCYDSWHEFCPIENGSSPKHVYLEYDVLVLTLDVVRAYVFTSVIIT